MTSKLGPNHAAARPSWECLVCLQPWPCTSAKTLLANEFYGFPAVLMVHMSAQLSEAMVDLTNDNAEAPPDLHDRFFGWIEAAAPDLDPPRNAAPAAARRSLFDHRRRPTTTAQHHR